MLPVVLLLGLLGVGEASGPRPQFEPLPKCSGCWSREDMLLPGIGFSLTTSYATAAVLFHNGSLLDVGKVRYL